MGDFTTAGEVESVTAHEVINNIGTFSHHPYIILHFVVEYENEIKFYILVVYYFAILAGITNWRYNA
jgi:hypothetical protein